VNNAWASLTPSTDTVNGQEDPNALAMKRALAVGGAQDLNVYIVNQLGEAGWGGGGKPQGAERPSRAATGRAATAPDAPPPRSWPALTCPTFLLLLAGNLAGAWGKEGRLRAMQWQSCRRPPRVAAARHGQPTCARLLSQHPAPPHPAPPAGYATFPAGEGRAALGPLGPGSRQDDPCAPTRFCRLPTPPPAPRLPDFQAFPIEDGIVMRGVTVGGGDNPG
jgi:hypothetical protein